MRGLTLKISILSPSLAVLVLLCATGVVEGAGERCDDDFDCKGKECCVPDSATVESLKTCRPHINSGQEGPHCTRPKNCRQNDQCGPGEVCVGCPCGQNESGLCGTPLNDWTGSEQDTADSFMTVSGSGSGDALGWGEDSDQAN